MSFLARLAVIVLTAVSFATAPATARAEHGPAALVELAKDAGLVGGGLGTAAVGAVVAVGAGATVTMTTLTVGTAIGLGIGYTLIAGGLVLAGYGVYRGGKALYDLAVGSNVHRSDATRGPSVPGAAPAGGGRGAGTSR